MRSGFLALALLLWSLGCTTPQPNSTADDGPRQPARSPTEPEVRLDRQIEGKVVSVNPVLRYVVIDFPIRRFPPLGQILSIYRGNQKVGEAKITGPSIDTTTAADIVIGEAVVGDTAREH
jgi:hypothetical protein